MFHEQGKGKAKSGESEEQQPSASVWLSVEVLEGTGTFLRLFEVFCNLCLYSAELMMQDDVTDKFFLRRVILGLV
jgi:hypothetical protein